MYEFDDLVLSTFHNTNGFKVELVIEPKNSNNDKQLVFKYYWYCFFYRSIVVKEPKDFITNILKIFNVNPTSYTDKVKTVIKLNELYITETLFNVNFNNKKHYWSGVEQAYKTCLNISSGNITKYLIVFTFIDLPTGDLYITISTETPSSPRRSDMLIGNIYSDDLYSINNSLSLLEDRKTFFRKYVNI